ncbi:hypothetical protein EIN_369550 [Entamoeba invadens IP1]|uniref:Uncharacterized protein n=1 Tax=Entamoeba invadens IP1 TaxID=370355 RepID=A0A0A1UBU6_ENTIV|nr:hypothetical protein EIN_369550 [Entamoeba invadens IP1]ELP92633.1 hypothetical protein EIN_369550 [Entamoeba invadens IP1]|eukprot:XP_004259404.1 hypothetical protein EIN_369550 [Entamoeba invadens IP1]
MDWLRRFFEEKASQIIVETTLEDRVKEVLNLDSKVERITTEYSNLPMMKKQNSQTLLTKKVEELVKDREFIRLTGTLKKYSHTLQAQKKDMENYIRQYIVKEKEKVAALAKSEYERDFALKIHQFQASFPQTLKEQIYNNLKIEFERELEKEKNILKTEYDKKLQIEIDKQNEILGGRRLVLYPAILNEDGKEDGKHSPKIKRLSKYKKCHSVDYSVSKPKVSRLNDLKKRDSLLFSSMDPSDENVEEFEQSSQDEKSEGTEVKLEKSEKEEKIEKIENKEIKTD